MKKKILALVGVLVLVAVLVTPMAAFAGNEATQNAETTKVTTIDIRNQAATTAISTITFPPTTAGTTGVIPYNNLDTISTPQKFDGSASLPVVTLVTDTAYIAWINIAAGTGWDETVSAEDYYIVTDDTRTVDETTFTNNKTTFSVWGTAVSTGTTLTVTSTNDNDLYLTVDLEAATGKTGTSTLTILGESV